MRRSRIKRSAPKRDWSAAREKIEREGVCRYCGDRVLLEAAHVTSREHDELGPDGRTFLVRPDSVIPLCRRHHEAYDRHEIDLLPFLFLPEQVAAVQAAGGIAAANRRLSGAR